MESSIVWIVIILQNFFIASRFILSQSILILVVLIVNFAVKLSQQEMLWRCIKKETIPNKWIKLTNTFAFIEITAEIDSYISRFDDGNFKAFQCSFCNYQNKDKEVVRSHIESKHSSISYSCPHCCHPCKSRTSLRVHIHRHHKLWINYSILSGLCFLF